MAESKIKSAMRGYSKDDVHEYISKMSDAAEEQMQKYISEIEEYKEEIARYRKKLKEKDSIIRELRKGESINGTKQ